MTHHFNFDNNDRPTLCAYCKAPAGPLLKKDKEHWLGACCMAHLKKLGEGERLPNKAQLNDIGTEYAIASTKNLYKKLLIDNKGEPLHEWERDDRKKIFVSIIREYLNWANARAREDDERLINGSKKILQR
ncbi:MAG: hypothetical protein HOH44_00070 [Bacteroidetes bacterium]|jgi:hypothetical protein|nr:hypothetical protein [Bacteroidota bacterium]